MPPPHRLAPGRSATALTLALVAGGAVACGVTGPSTVATVVPASAAYASPTPRLEPRLVLRLTERRLYLVDDVPGTPHASFPVAVGREGSETPVGRFQVEELIENPDFLQIVSGAVVKRIPPGPANPLGERWIGFVRGDGWTIGIHGTPNPELLGRAVSRGCVRMRNADVIAVYERVRIGTPVVVEP